MGAEKGPGDMVSTSLCQHPKKIIGQEIFVLLTRSYIDARHVCNMLHLLTFLAHLENAWHSNRNKTRMNIAILSQKHNETYCH